MIAKLVSALDSVIPSVMVKEIRQGLNSWAFLAQFFGVHAVLAFMTLAQMASLAQSDGMGFNLARGAFWFLMGAFFLFVVPLMSINAVSSEKQGGTIELIRMTGLGPRGVVWGKWAYQAVFIVMVATSIYPYIVLYHLVSGSDLMEETLQLVFIALGSLLFLGISVGASGFGTNIFKVLIFLGVLFLLFSGGVSLYGTVRRSGLSLLSSEGIALVLGIGVPLMLFMLETASARIGSRLDGFSFAIRTLGFTMLVIPAVLMNLKVFPEVCFVFCILVVIVVPWFALMGAPVLSPGPYRRYLRFGRLGKFLGRFLFYPGWVSGTLYASALILVFVVILLLQLENSSFGISKKDIEQMLYVFTSIAMLPFQICLIRVFFQKDETDWALPKVIGINVGLLLFAFGLGVLKVYFGFNMTPWFSFIPSNAVVFIFFGAFEGVDPNFATHQLFAYIGHMVVVLCLLLLGQRYWGRYAELEAKAAAINQGSAKKR